MKLDRYVLKELMLPFLIGTFAVVLMFQANLLIFLFKTYSLSSIPFQAILKLLLFKTPFFLNMTLPVGMALSTSLAVTRLVRESEVTAMRSAGASILRIILPITIFGALVGVGNYFLVEKVMPPAEHEATKLNTQLAMLGALPEFRPNIVITLGDYTANIKTLYRQPDGSYELNDAWLLERPRQGETVVFTADKGTYRDGVFTFPDASCWRFKGDSLDQFQAKTLVISQRVNINEIFSQAQPTEMTLGELKDAIVTAKQQRQDTASLEVQYQVRYSVPAACWVFAIVGPVFAMWFGRSGGLVGVLLSILMVLVYYNVFIISTEIFGRNHWVSPFMAAWLPNFLFVALAAIGLRRLE